MCNQYKEYCACLTLMLSYVYTPNVKLREANHSLSNHFQHMTDGICIFEWSLLKKKQSEYQCMENKKSLQRYFLLNEGMLHIEIKRREKMDTCFCLIHICTVNST